MVIVVLPLESVAVKSAATPVVEAELDLTTIIQSITVLIRTGVLLAMHDKMEMVDGMPYTTYVNGLIERGEPDGLTVAETWKELVAKEGLVAVNVKTEFIDVGVNERVVDPPVAPKSAVRARPGIEAPNMTVIEHDIVTPTRTMVGAVQDNAEAVVGTS